ncbi:MAG: hypothetical protein U1F10_10795 [Burkholderiales bacterium]
MPLLSADQLLTSDAQHAALARIAGAPPGLVLSVGGPSSGKLTLLLAIAYRIAGARPVVLLTDTPDHYAPFHPLPPTWRERVVAATPAAWEAALRDAGDALTVVAPLAPASAAPTVARARHGWTLAAVEDVRCGLAAMPALTAMGVPRDAFVDTVRAVWSQFLVPGLCPDCALPATLPAAEMQALLGPRAAPATDVRSEQGCPACAGSGTRGREAVCDVVVVDDGMRPALRRALADGTPFAPPATARLSALDQARDLLCAGYIGVGTFRDAVRAHPWLRAQAGVARGGRA